VQEGVRAAMCTRRGPVLFGSNGQRADLDQSLSPTEVLLCMAFAHRRGQHDCERSNSVYGESSQFRGRRGLSVLCYETKMTAVGAATYIDISVLRRFSCVRAF